MVNIIMQFLKDLRIALKKNAPYKINYYSSAEPIEEPVYYYQYEKLQHDGGISISTRYLSDASAKHYEYTEVNGWYKIESSRRQWEH
jgi:hypothetical protein